jgi:4-hydroxythreonine-4-phosphate dehydrogenase
MNTAKELRVSLSSHPTVVLATGCPAGIGPELAAHVFAAGATPAGCRLIGVGDARVLEKGAAAMKCKPQARMLSRGEPIPAAPGQYFVDLGNLDPATIAEGELSTGASAFAIENFSTAIDTAMSGEADAVAWTPFNKACMRLTHPSYNDEIVFTAEKTGFTGTASEFNILPDLWNARVTSHVALSGVAALITFDNVMRGLRLTHQAMRESGFANPRIAIAALNPHAGDGGNFGREEIDVLEPVVAAARKEGIRCDGPFPSDTVFVRARRGDYDAVLTMFHDQGQIAMKLMGFEAGVTLLGGFAFPLVTAAHGSAYDIAYKGVANPGAMMNAMDVAFRMASTRNKAKAA